MRKKVQVLLTGLCLGFKAGLLGSVFILSSVVFANAVLAESEAQEAEQVMSFNIPRSRADKALVRFARQADVTLLYPYREVKRLRIGPLKGRYAVNQGLEALLADSGIRISAGLADTNQEEIDNMKNPKKAVLPAVISLAVFGGSDAIGQSDLTQATPAIEEQVVLGSRTNKARSVSDSPVPVDVFTSEQFSSIGGAADITDNLKALVPSYTATPATGDGSAFVRPTSLRGMASDQTLVLVNGKRRHRSALVQFFAPAAGAGSHSPDVAMIPSLALKNIQVLRDGAAAQYGSDAIAGVMNFELKDDREGGEIHIQAGQHFEGEANYRISGNLGLPLGDNGFINITGERVDNDGISRGFVNPAAQFLIDNGVQGVGADAPFGDAPRVQSWGRPETRGTRWIFNAGYELDNGDELYAFGNSANTFGRYRFFYRGGDDPTTPEFDPVTGSGGVITSFLNNFGTGALTGTPGDGSFDDTGGFLPAGFTPFLDGNQSDSSLVVGLKGESESEISYDISVGYGKNELDYFLNNTLNSAVAPISPNQVQRDFDVGAYSQTEINLNADFSQELRDGLFLSYGAEWREEEFELITGEPNATVGTGPSGFRPPDESNAGSHTRSNWAVYVDVEQDISDDWLMQYALRYEDFSDFGDTINGKIATRYSISDETNIRAAISTGFHAPTPGQANISSLLTTFDGFGGIQLEGLVPADSPEAALVGGAPLKEEESVNFSIGMTTSIGFADLTVDAYMIQVDDRIYRTGNILIDPADPSQSLSYFTNALDVEHQGIDIVLTGDVDWGVTTNLSFAYSYNKVDVTDIATVVTALGESVTPVSASTAEDIENNFPNSRFTFTTNTQFNDRLNLMVRANYYGEHFDERGTIGGAPGSQSAEIGAVIFFDAELGYDLNDNARLVLGASNIFDEFPDEIPNDGILANRQSVGLQYPRRTPVNYEGGSYYLKAIYSF